MRTDMSRTDT